MRFELEAFVRLRPWCYHYTALENASLIARARRMYCAAHWLEAAHQRHAVRSVRRQHQYVIADGAAVVLRDQRALHAGNVALDSGVSFQDIIELLNRHVFFWPGNGSGPVKAGARFAERYRTEGLVRIGVRTEELIAANLGRTRLCSFNSGAPRCNKGRPSQRGARTFLPPDQYDRTAGRVQEVAFFDYVDLPDFERVQL